MTYVEEREFTLRFELSCEFSEDYDGDEDGYEWAKGFEPLAAQIVKAAMAQISRSGYAVHAKNRGRPSDEEVTLVVKRVLRKT